MFASLVSAYVPYGGDNNSGVYRPTQGITPTTYDSNINKENFYVYSINSVFPTLHNLRLLAGANVSIANNPLNSSITISAIGGSGSGLVYTGISPIVVNNDTNQISLNAHIPTEAQIDANALGVINGLDLNNTLSYLKSFVESDPFFFARFVSVFDGNFFNRFTQVFDGNFFTRFTQAFDGNFFGLFKPAFDSNISALDLNNSLNYAKGYVPTESDIDQNALGIVNGLDLNNSLSYLKTFVGFDGNFYSLFTLVFDGNFYQVFTNVFDGNFNRVLSTKTTDDLNEGSINLYFSDNRVFADINSLDLNNTLQYLKTVGYIPTEADIDANALAVVNGLDLNNTLSYLKSVGYIPTESDIDANALAVINALDLNNTLSYLKTVGSVDWTSLTSIPNAFPYNKIGDANLLTDLNAVFVKQSDGNVWYVKVSDKNNNSSLPYLVIANPPWATGNGRTYTAGNDPIDVNNDTNVLTIMVGLIPTSGLYNDAGFITAEQDPNFYGWLGNPPGISTFVNDSGYLIPPYNATGALTNDGSGILSWEIYMSSIAGQPISQLVNDSQYMTKTNSDSNYLKMADANKAGFLDTNSLKDLNLLYWSQKDANVALRKVSDTNNNSSIKYATIADPPAISSPAWTLVDENILTGIANDISFSGLTGDTAKDYMFVLNVKPRADNQILRMRFNDTADSYSTQRITIDRTGVLAGQIGNDATTGIVLWQGNDIDGGNIFVNGTILALSFYTQVNAQSNATYSQYFYDIGNTVFGQWNNSAQVTKITITSNVTNGFDIGSRFTLFKRI